MKGKYWKRYAIWVAGVLMTLGMSSAVFAQETLEQRFERLEKQNEDIRKNADALQKQNAELLRLLQSGPSNPVSTPTAAPLAADDVRNIVSSYLQEKESQQAAAQAAGSVDSDGRYKIGSDLRITGSCKNGLVFATP